MKIQSKFVNIKTMLSVSEIADYVYCKRSWWLYRSKKTSVDRDTLDQMREGNLVHLRYWRKAQLAVKMQYLGILCVIVTLCGFMFLIW